MKLLAATDFLINSHRALRRAGRFARALSGAELSVVHVVSDGRSDEQARIDAREAGRILREQIGSMLELRDLRCRALVGLGRPEDGILRAAEESAADLIVLGAPRRTALPRLTAGTTLRRLVRTGRFPVLMVRGEPDASYRRVMVAMERSAGGANAIAAAERLGLMAGEAVTLLHAFAPRNSSRMAWGGDRYGIAGYVAAERERARHDLGAFLAVNDISARRWSMRVEEGTPFEVIARTVEQERPDLLVLAPTQRSGIARLLLGSVTEEALRRLDVDVLAVPATARAAHARERSEVAEPAALRPRRWRAPALQPQS